MKIYFSGSMRGGRKDAIIYRQIIKYLGSFGVVLTEHVGNNDIADLVEARFDDFFIHKRDMDKLLACNVVVAEVSTPSLGVGYEIGRAVEHHKPVLCLYRPQEGKRLSAMIAGCKKLTVAEYNKPEETKKIIDEFIKQIYDL
jgi:hypothetical protein